MYLHMSCLKLFHFILQLAMLGVLSPLTQLKWNVLDTALEISLSSQAIILSRARPLALEAQVADNSVVTGAPGEPSGAPGGNGGFYPPHPAIQLLIANPRKTLQSLRNGLQQATIQSFVISGYVVYLFFFYVANWQFCAML